MKPETNTLADVLPLLAQSTRTERLFLYVIRRIAVGGLKDAHASNALMGTFGISHKRVQMFMRVFMSELARASSRTITIAPCCCRRMTAHEWALISIVTDARETPIEQHQKLKTLLGNPDCRAPLAAAIGLADVFSDLGHPLR